MNTKSDRPRIAAMFRLQFEPVQDCWVLLYPEGMVKLNGPAAEILRRCDGQRSVAEIRMIDALKDTFIMLLPMLAVLALVILWPDVTLFLPRIVSPEFLQ